jgi:hypothetical protein
MDKRERSKENISLPSFQLRRKEGWGISFFIRHSNSLFPPQAKRGMASAAMPG